MKIIRYIRWTRALRTISRASLKLMKYVFTKTTWKVVVTASISKWIVRSMPERIPPQVTVSESSHVQWFFIQQKAHLSLRPFSLDNTLNRPSSAWESFNIRQKLGLFVLGVTHMSNLPTDCVKLMRVGGWV